MRHLRGRAGISWRPRPASVGDGCGASITGVPDGLCGRQLRCARSFSTFGRGWAASLEKPPPEAYPTPRRRPVRPTGSFDGGPGGSMPPGRILGALALLKSPGELDSEGLGRAATTAAREGLVDEEWWQMLAERTKELAPTLALHDAACILNGMARSRRIDQDVVKALLPRISSHMVYLTSAHLSMMASAVAKAEVHDARFTGLLTREIKARMTEFQSPMELTMIINAVSKLRVTEEDLYRRLSTHMQNRMSYEEFHVRDLSVIVAAFARVQCADSSMLKRFADAAVETLPQATAPELARLMHAYMSVSSSATDCKDLLSACVLHCKELTSRMDPGALTSAAFAFGQCFEVAQVGHMPYMRKIFRHIRLASLRSLPLFLPKDIVSLLRTYSRWQVSFEMEHLRKVAERMLGANDLFDAENAVAALYSLAVLVQRSSVRSANSPTNGEEQQLGCPASVTMAAKALLGNVWTSVAAGKLPAASMVRAVEASTMLLPGDKAPLAAVAAFLARRGGSVEIDLPARSTLYELLTELGCKPDEDLLLVLREGLTLPPP
eukprot:TRINITY_DN114187_c0_g1_i1.p1 TRINITY_DN114187_c0_g1~~TRINITY_DN114187_c0_g1_i1.p1  ORF type:complete len:552 (+),score=95.80 TRINITY_DN114187_c0_g1_i1:147-1802(+)